MKLFYRQSGQGLPVIILHGLFGSSDNWMSIGKKLSENYKVFLVDQRNHGQSENTPEFNYEIMAEDLRDFIEEHKIIQPIVVGHSMGGKVAMKFATKYPEMLRKLVVVDIAPRAYPVHHQKILEGLNSINLSSLKSRTDADMALAQHEPIQPVRQFLLKNLYRNSSGAFDWRINLPVITEKIEAVGELIQSDAPVDVPTLFMGGTNSAYIVESDHTDIKAIFPKAEIRMISNAGHWIHAEQPVKFIEVLNRFIAG
ncbi:alpha/beta fold hydrolase [Flammeovirgaceae bacterium SG7u.111]|nr:alpha/beta fold hydrolase [Flammeovirgaceae bacterium SG7u.132]WPO34443.1 alpha/beta fold hydrolase [Flammeovirgaceae bacterium SG7u.111]